MKKDEWDLLHPHANGDVLAAGFKKQISPPRADAGCGWK